MNEILEKILNEVQGLKREMNIRFKEQDAKIEARFKKQDERIEARFKEQDERIESKFKEQDDRITGEFKNIYKMFDKVNKRFDVIDEKFATIDVKFEIQSKELAQELRTMADFIYERDKKLIKDLEEKLDEEIKYNRIVQKAQDARISKVELYQEALESKVHDLATIKKAV